MMPETNVDGGERHHQSDCFAGWERYPLNLRDIDPFMQDGQRYQERLRDLSHLLFSDKVSLRVIDVDYDKFRAEFKNLNGTQDVEEYFRKRVPSLRVISIARKNSLLNFRISSEVLCKILTCHSVSPVFLDMLFGLRSKDEMSEKGFGIWETVSGSTRYHEICYQLRYVEQNDHQQGRKWSERQVGVYHSFRDGSKDPAVMILMHAMPGSRLQRRMDAVLTEERPPERKLVDPMMLHVLIFSTYLDEWRWYMDDLGSTCIQLENEGFTAELRSKMDRSLSFRTLQELRNMESMFLTMSTIFAATLATLESLQKQCEDIDQTDGVQNNETTPLPAKTSRAFIALHALSQKCRSYTNSIEIMQNRAGKLIELLADGLNQKSQGTAAEISGSLLALTKRSVDDNVTVRIVTIITLIYLPTQFVATFFGTNFVVFDTNIDRIRFATDFWIFLAVAIPLTMITLSIWFLSTRKEKVEKAKDAELLEKAEQFEDA